MFYVLAVLVVVTLFCVMLWFFFLRGGLTLRVFGNLFSRRLGGDVGPTLARDTPAEGEGFEPPRALA